MNKNIIQEFIVAIIEITLSSTARDSFFTVAETRQHSRVDCNCLLKFKYDYVKPKNTVKFRTRII